MSPRGGVFGVQLSGTSMDPEDFAAGGHSWATKLILTVNFEAELIALYGVAIVENTGVS